MSSIKIPPQSASNCNRLPRIQAGERTNAAAPVPGAGCPLSRFIGRTSAPSAAEQAVVPSHSWPALTDWKSVLRQVHADQRGTISIVAVPTIIFLTMLMGMLINVGRHVDDKVKMQNGADAATYTGGVVLARGMNGLAFTNHLLCDVFALTAIMREARDQHVDPLIPSILQAWSNIGPIFANSQFPKFAALGRAIPQKVPLEQGLVNAYSSMMAALSPLLLPVLENILQQKLIPQFQRALVQTLPKVAQSAASEIAKRHGMYPAQQPGPRGAITAVLWRTRILPVGYPDETDPLQRTLPAVDPDPSGNDYNSLPARDQYLDQAIERRRHYARIYLTDWNGWINPNDMWDDFLQFFDTEGKMSQYSNLWRVFCCGQLEKLFTEYPQTNLPHMIRLTESGVDADTLRDSGNTPAMNQYLDMNFNFVGVAYGRHMTETSSGMFKNRLVTGAAAQSTGPLAYAQVSVFVPRPRHRCCPWAWPQFQQGQLVGWVDNMDNWPTHWDLFNQNWTAQLSPGSSDSISAILTSPMTQQLVQNYQPPSLGAATPQSLRQINTH